MPTPYGDLTTSDVWKSPTEEILETLPSEEVTEVVIEVEDDE